jgi:hypothetical protein
MNTPIRCALFAAASLAFAVAPVSVFGSSNGQLLAAVECLDCQFSVYCCADCKYPSQEGKCTMGMPWCPVE